MYLGVDPAEGFQALHELVLGQLVWQVNVLVGAPLGRHHDAADLLHLSRRNGANYFKNTSPKLHNYISEKKYYPNHNLH